MPLQNSKVTEVSQMELSILQLENSNDKLKYY